MSLVANRNSLWLSQPSTSSSSSPDSPKRPRTRRASTYSSTVRPSTSTSALDVIGEGDLHSHFTTRTPRRPKRDRSESHSMANRASFIDLGQHSSREFLDNGLLGSIKGRLHRKSSAPSLSGPAPVVYEPMPSMPPSTPTKSSKHSSGLKWPSPGRSFREKTGPLRQSFSLSGRSSRKSSGGSKSPHAAQPSPLRRRYSQDESDVFEGGNGAEARYQPLGLARRGCSQFHKYAPHEAPYMLSYDRVNLQNDYYTNILLQRLNKNKTPSFHNYTVPPQHVLDLGCGEGLWVKEAAAAWGEYGTQIVGFDLVDLVDKSAGSSETVTWKRGNLLHPLPFITGSFDLVRLANLTTVVPKHRWEHVLRECRRVMKSGGRLELIDDELMFSYPATIQGTEWARASYWDGELPSKSNRSSWDSMDHSRSVSSKSSRSRLSEEITSSFLDMDNATAVEAAPSLVHDDSPSEESFDSLPTPANSDEGFETHIGSIRGFKSQPAYTACQRVEKIFEMMLEDEFRIDPRPGSFMLELLGKVFGRSSGTKALKDHTLYLLHPEFQEIFSGQKPSSVKRNPDDPTGQLKRMFDEKVATSRPSSARGQRKKASKILGEDVISLSRPSVTIVDPSDDIPNASNEPMLIKTPSRTPSLVTIDKQVVFKPVIDSLKLKKKYNPNGLYSYPDDFHEMSAEELEWHLFKHTNTLLGCRAALDRFALSLRSEDGSQLLDRNDWHDMLWEYESSRRLRFNLPGISGGFDDFDQNVDSSQEPNHEPTRAVDNTIHSFLAENRAPHPDVVNDISFSCHPVRRIRVFEAFKL